MSIAHAPMPLLVFFTNKPAHMLSTSHRHVSKNRNVYDIFKISVGLGGLLVKKTNNGMESYRASGTLIGLKNFSVKIRIL